MSSIFLPGIFSVIFRARDGNVFEMTEKN